MRPQLQSDQPEPLGPDSLTWKYFGDWRGVLLAPWAGAMQNMHPGLGAGVEEHSRFFEERWQRLFRSLYPIGGVVYDGPRAAETARQIRGYHKYIKGVDKKGRPYHALDPDTYYWAHATFLMMPILINEYFGDHLTEVHKEQLYAESIQWYRLYGMSMRPVPPDWASFQRYWDHMCADVLEDNAATRQVLEFRDIAKPPLLRWLPDALWRVARRPVMSGSIWLATGLFPPAVRQRLGLRWTATDERLLRLGGRGLALAWKLVPARFRYHPRARAGWARAAGKLPADAPLVETPPRNLPPVEHRDDPRHYAPAL